MANRHTKGTTRYLTRAPRTVCVKFTSTGSTGAQTLTNTGPFNYGIYEVNNTTTGTYVVQLGGSSVQKDPYAYLAGVDFIADETDIELDYWADDCTNASNPTVTLYLTDTDASAKDVTSAQTAWVRLHFVDSMD